MNGLETDTCPSCGGVMIVESDVCDDCDELLTLFDIMGWFDNDYDDWEQD